MSNYTDDYVYCDPLRREASLEEQIADPSSSVHEIHDPGDNPETALIRKQNRERIDAFCGGLPDGLRQIAEAWAMGKSQASVARDEGISGAAITKRAYKLRVIGRAELADLRYTGIV